NAQIAFKRETNNDHLWIRTGFNRWPKPSLSGSPAARCWLRQGLRREDQRRSQGALRACQERRESAGSLQRERCATPSLFAAPPSERAQARETTRTATARG